MNLRIRSAAALAAALGVALALPAVAEEEKAAPPEAETAKADAAAVVADGSKVSIEYTLTLDDGEVADTNVGRDPLTYEQGKGQILPALEKALVGLGVGASKKVELSADQGYGPVRPELYETVEASQIPEEARSVGTMLVAQAPDGQQRPVRVHEVNDDQVVLDLNHPLAGKALHFSIKVLAIE